MYVTQVSILKKKIDKNDYIFKKFTKIFRNVGKIINETSPEDYTNLLLLF